MQEKEGNLAKPVAADSRAVGQFLSISCKAFILLTRYSSKTMQPLKGSQCILFFCVTRKTTLRRTHPHCPFSFFLASFSGGQPAEQLQVHQVPEGVLVGGVPHRDAVPVVRTHGNADPHSSQKPLFILGVGFPINLWTLEIPLDLAVIVLDHCQMDEGLPKGFRFTWSRIPGSILTLVKATVVRGTSHISWVQILPTT